MRTPKACTRFVIAATERRRQRKHQQLAENEHELASNNSDVSRDTPGGMGEDENVQRENKENKDKFPLSLGLACDPTLSTTFDDMTVSTKDFSQSMSDSGRISCGSRGPSQPPSQVTTSNKTFNFAGPMPSGPIPCQSKEGKNNDKLSTISTQLTTPRRGNQGYYHNELRRVGASVPSTASVTTVLTVNTNSLNSSVIANTPKNNILGVTPKYNDATMPAQNTLNDDSFSVMSAVTTLEKMKILTKERDKYRSDVAIFKRKLNIALEKKTAIDEEKKHALSKLEKELELTKAQKQYAEYQLKLMEKKMNEHTDAKVSSLRNEMKSVNSKLHESLEELARVQQLNRYLGGEKGRVETREKALKDELKKAENDRFYMQNKMKESSKRWEHMEIEFQQKEVQHAKYKAQLELSLKDLQREKQMHISESMVQLSSVENQLSNALAEKQYAERSLQLEISYLQNELQTQKSNCESIKQQNSSIVESLKSDLVTAGKLREESVSAIQKEFDLFKEECNDSMARYKDEVETLRSQLHDTKNRADQYENKLDSVMEENNSLVQQLTQAQKEVENLLSQMRNVERPLEKENESLVQQLTQAQKDIDGMKSVCDKDILLLKLELEKKHQENVQMESEFKDTKWQLNNALRNLNDMALDGSRMRDDLEGFLNNFTMETNNYQNMIDGMKKVSEEQQSQLMNLQMENERYEHDCNMLREKVLSLEEKLVPRDSNKVSDEHATQLSILKHLRRENEDYETECSQLRQSVALLEERLTQEREELKRHRRDVLLLEPRHHTNKLDEAMQEAAQSELSEHRAKISELEAENLRLTMQISQPLESREHLRATQRETSLELSRAQQMIQILKSKERYLESKVDSLSNQISKTVRDYEMRLMSSSSNDSSNSDS